MVIARLIGSATCRRYRKMRESVRHAAEGLGIELNLEEINDDARLAEYNPLSLPRLYIQEDLIASRNPPRPQDVAKALSKKGSFEGETNDRIFRNHGG